MKRTISCLFLLLLLTACVPAKALSTTMTATTVPSQTETTTVPWWKSAVFYEIFVRSFYDSNGDGIGDFNGITEKLDYLQTLGVNALWLMPVYPSPSYHGYDVINYFNVNPQYGSMQDFKNLVNEVHKRGMHLILDMELNHSSNQNPWFTNSNQDKGSPYRDWYIWSDADPKTVGPNGGEAWFPGQYGFYYGVFGSKMPDLNYTNPDVTNEMEKVVSYWLNDVGVDGFRLDAINYLIEDPGKLSNSPSTHNWLKNFYTFYKSEKADSFTVGEVYGADASLAKTYTGNQMDMVFDFEVALGILNSAKGGANSGINSALTFAQQALPDWSFGTFLTNHDQNRVMSTLSGNIDQAKNAAFMLLTAPGTPFIYYGEEIGMTGEKPDEMIRTPMQWNVEANSGFSSNTPWEPVNSDYKTVNVASETDDPLSLLNFYSDLLRIRNGNPALAYGDLAILNTSQSAIYATLRSLDGHAYLIVANLSNQPVANPQISFNRSNLQPGTYKLTSLIGDESFSDLTIDSNGSAKYQPIGELAANTRLIFTLGK